MNCTTMETKNWFKPNQKHRVVLRNANGHNLLVGPWRKTREEAEADRPSLVKRYLDRD